MRAARICSSAVVLTAAALGLAFVYPFGNPVATPSPPRSGLLQGATMSAAARQVLVSKCADCHSDSTHWPVYTHVAPISWMVEKDVVDGRGHMNLSQWLELSADQQEVLSTEIVGQAKKGAMPPFQYRMVHRGSGLTQEDVAALLTLAPHGATAGQAAAGDPDRGQAVFQKRCTGCHAIDSDREGPRLRGVYGRKAGTVGGFTYSAAMRRSGITWTNETLERWLSDSDEMVPQSNMGFAVPKAQDRADLVSYLRKQQ